MRIAIIGAGRVGRALGQRWSAGGHDVVYGVRDVEDPKHHDLPVVRTPQTAVDGADVVLLAVPWPAAQEACSHLRVGDAVVLDASNPLAAGARDLQLDPNLSGAELVRDWLGGARVVKAFNCTGSANMVNPAYGPARPAMPVAGDDAAAKGVAISLANEIGFDGFDAGPLAAARDLEHLAMLWIRLAFPLGNGVDIAFALLRR